MRKPYPLVHIRGRAAVALVVLTMGMLGCELLVDFDRSKIPEEGEQGSGVGEGDGGLDDAGGGDGGDATAQGNRPPVARDDMYSAQVGRRLETGDAGLLANDNDPDGDPLAIVDPEVIRPTRGLLALREDGRFTFLATGVFELQPDEREAVTFSYRITDGEDESEPAAVTIVVRGSAGPMPKANPDEYTVSEDDVLRVSVEDGLAANDEPPAEDSELRYDVFSPPARGTLDLAADGSFTYSPPTDLQTLTDDQPETVTFQYVVEDAAGAADAAEVRITVIGRNDPPIPAAASAATVANLAVVAPAGALLAGATDAEGDPLSAVPQTDTETDRGGLLSVAADGGYTYLPPVGQAGIEDRFTFSLTDGTGTGTGTGTVRVDGPVHWFVDDDATVPGDGRSTRPWPSLALAEQRSGPGDTIYVHPGRYGRIALRPQQRLVGAGVPLLAVLGGEAVTVMPPADPPTLSGPGGPLVTLADGSEVAGLVLAESDQHGIAGDQLGAVTLRDVRILAPAARGITLSGLTGEVVLSAVTIENAGTDGLAISDSTGPVTAQALQVLDANANDPSPGAGGQAPASGVRLERNTGLFALEGGVIGYTGDNRSPAILARNVTDLRLAGTENDPLEIFGAGRGTAGSAPPSVLVERAHNVTAEHVVIHDQVPQSPVVNPIPGALQLVDVAETIAVEHCDFGSFDGRGPILGHGLHVLSNAASEELVVTALGNRFASAAGVPGETIDAMAVRFTGTGPQAFVTAVIDDTEVTGTWRAVRFTVNNGPGPNLGAYDLTVSRLSATDLRFGGVLLEASNLSSGVVEIRDCDLSGWDGAPADEAVGISADLRANGAWDISVLDNAIHDFSANGIALRATTGAAACRALVQRNTLSDTSVPIASLGGGILLQTGGAGTLDATVRENNISWSQHAIVTDVRGTTRLCLDAQGNAGAGTTAPADDFFLHTADGGAIAISQSTIDGLGATNNGVPVTVTEATAPELAQTCNLP